MLVKSVDYKFDDEKIWNVKYDECERTLMTKEFVEQVVIPALEKQIPKKPTQIGSQICTCPACSHKIIKSDYCSDCGQALDWSDKNDL